MKTGFKEHIGAAVLFILAIVISLNQLSNQVFLLASFIFVVSSVIPDIDHPKSIPRKIARALFFVLVLCASIVILLLFAKPEPVATLLITPSLALLIAFLLTFLFESTIPGHREELHSKMTALLFGLGVFLICLTSLPLYDSALFGIFTAAGYVFHILVDFIGDKI